MLGKFIKLFAGRKTVQSAERVHKQLDAHQTFRKSSIVGIAAELQTIGLEGRVYREEYRLELRKKELLEFMDNAQELNDVEMMNLAHEKAVELKKEYEVLLVDYQKLANIKRGITDISHIKRDSQQKFQDVTASPDPYFD